MAQAIDLKGLVLPQLVEAHRREDHAFISEFRIQPLERGFGHTLGNAMRRMLLSSLRGSAVWAFRIDGVVHEHRPFPASPRTCTRSSPISRRSCSRSTRTSRAPSFASASLVLDRSRGRHPGDRVRPGREPEPSPLHPAGRPRDQRRTVREQGARLRRVRHACPRTRAPRRPGSDRLALQPGTPCQLHGRRNARWPAYGLRPPHADGRDQRHHHAGRGRQLCGGAGADALPVLRRLWDKRVGHGHRGRRGGHR